MRGDVGKLPGTGDVADRVQPRQGSFHIRGDRNKAFGDVDPQRFQAQAGDDVLAANRDQQNLRFLHGRFAGFQAAYGDAHAVLIHLDLFQIGPGLQQQLYAILSDDPFQLSGDFGILQGKQAIQLLDQGDPAAEVPEDRGEFQTDDAGAKNGDRLGQRLKIEDLVAGHDAVFRELDRRRHNRRGPRGQDDVGRFDPLLSAVSGDGDGIPVRKPGLDAPRAVPDFHPVFVHQEFDAPEHPLHDGVFAVHHLRKGESRRLFQLDAPVFRLDDLAVKPGGFQHRLRRNAPFVQAGSPEFVLLDKQNLQPVMGGADGGRVTSRSSADDDKIESADD
jgi:hypothetical protein